MRPNTAPPSRPSASRSAARTSGSPAAAVSMLTYPAAVGAIKLRDRNPDGPRAWAFAC